MLKGDPSIIDAFYLRELKKQLEKKSGISIQEFNDCKTLSDFFIQQGLAISAHTFARFYGLLKENHRPYTSTLNLICLYLGFESYSNFCATIKDELTYALHSPTAIFGTGDYSFIALEIAIINNDWDSMKALLETIDKSIFRYQDLVIVLGNAVRAHPLQEAIIKELTTIENGRWLFFECFVDEDDHNHYYSNALKHYYQNVNSKPGNQLFLHCFLASKAIYNHQPIEKSTMGFLRNNNFSVEGLHFHEISRLFELQILLDHQNNQLEKRLVAQLDKIIETTSSYVHYDACWLLARSIKALAFSGMLKKAMTYTPFQSLVYHRFKQINANIESIGELIIQFVGHAFFLNKKEHDLIIPPSKIGVKHDNETQARILIEAATAQLYASQPVKSILDKNILSFARKTGQTWVFELLN